MKKLIEKEILESSKTIENAVSLSQYIEKAVNEITECLKLGNKVIIFGNGGSAADSQHIAAEFIGRYLKERQSLPAIALSTDTSILTSLGNDYYWGSPSFYGSSGPRLCQIRSTICDGCDCRMDSIGNVDCGSRTRYFWPHNLCGTKHVGCVWRASSSFPLRHYYTYTR